jgi:DNA-directed RNA polymerase sigma subunit (sigma70/sigma32)
MPAPGSQWTAASRLAVASLDEVAEQLGCTRQRVQQIEAKALEKLRLKLAARGFTLQDFVDCVEVRSPDWNNIKE